MPRLYPHQLKAISETPDKWFLWWSMRCGKSPAAIRLACDRAKSAIIIAPKSVVCHWKREVETWRVGECDFIVTSPEQFKKHVKELPACEAIIVDECLDGDTRIKTVSGDKKIRDVKVGDVVYTLLGCSKVKKTIERYSHEIMHIKFSNKESLKITGNHPILTPFGWKKSKQLSIGDCVLTNNFSIFIMLLGIINKIKKYGKIYLYNMRKISLSQQVQTKKDMFKGMRAEIDVYKSEGSSHKGYHFIRKKINWIKKIQQRTSGKLKKIFVKNEKEKSYDEKRDSRKSFSNTKKNWTQASSPRRKRKRNDCAAKDIIYSAWRWLDGRIYSENIKDFKGYTVSLQNRHSEPSKKDSSRSGWWLSLFRKIESERQEKRKSSFFTRVESIEIQKQRNNGKSSKGFKVYNLEISGHPSYIANNIIVHNCHSKYGNYRNQAYKALMFYVEQHNPRFIWGLSGTPMTASHWCAYSYGLLLGKKWLWVKWNRFFNFQVYMGPRKIWMPRKDRDKDLQDILRSIGTTLKLSDITTVIEDQDVIETFSLNSEQKKLIKPLITELPIVRFTAEHQLEQGVRTADSYREEVLMECEKDKRLVELVKEVDKVIIVCRYHAQINKYVRLLSKLNRKIFIISGQSKQTASEIAPLAEVENNCIVIAQSDSCVGYSLKSFNVMIFASMSFSFSNFTQMRSRMKAVGKIEPCQYIYLITEGDSIDKAVYDAVMRKQDFSIALYEKK